MAKLYDVGNRNILEQGQTYMDHVMAMTEESLHSKSDIAAELAHRDLQIQNLVEELLAACAMVRALGDQAQAQALAGLSPLEDQ